MKPLIYIASPYQNPSVDTNVEKQKIAANALIDNGYSPVWPLCNHYLHLEKYRGWQDWMDILIPQLLRCDGLWRLPGESVGADEEVRIALQHGIEVRCGSANECPWLGAEIDNYLQPAIQTIVEDPSRKLSDDDYFMGIALMTAYKSKDPSSKTGAIFVDEDKRIVSTGYNGFPADYPQEVEYELIEDRNKKYAQIIHAEMNALIGAAQTGRSLKNCTCYVNWTPCSNCAKHLAAAGVKEVVVLDLEDEDLALRWQPEWEVTEMIFANAGINFRKIKCGINLPRIINGKGVKN